MRATTYPSDASSPPSPSLSARHMRIVSLLKEQSPLTGKMIHALLHLEISERTLRLDLKFLRQKGWLNMEGAGPSVTWQLTSSARKTLN